MKPDVEPLTQGQTDIQITFPIGRKQPDTWNLIDSEGPDDQALGLQIRLTQSEAHALGQRLAKAFKLLDNDFGDE